MRIVAIIVWAAAGFWGWLGLCVLGGRIIVHQLNEGTLRPPDWVAMLLSAVPMLGILIIPTFLAVLGLRGRLPGTRRKTAPPGGFPVVVNGDVPPT